MLSGGNTAAEAFAPAVVNALPSRVVDSLNKAKTCWLKNTELAKLLRDYQHLGFCVSAQAPYRPPSESMHTRLHAARAIERWHVMPLGYLQVAVCFCLTEPHCVSFARTATAGGRRQMAGLSVRLTRS